MENIRTFGENVRCLLLSECRMRKIPIVPNFAIFRNRVERCGFRSPSWLVNDVVQEVEDAGKQMLKRYCTLSLVCLNLVSKTSLKTVEYDFRFP